MYAALCSHYSHLLPDITRKIDEKAQSSSEPREQMFTWARFWYNPLCVSFAALLCTRASIQLHFVSVFRSLPRSLDVLAVGMHRESPKNQEPAEIKIVEFVQWPSAPVESEYALTNTFGNDNYRNFEFNGRLYSSVWPARIDLLSESEQEELKNAPWFQAGLPRKLSLEILLQQPPGSFLIRHSESHKKCFVLSMRVEPADTPKLSHYLIEKTCRGYKIKGFTKEFTTLTSLVIHHSVLKEKLPIALVLQSSRRLEHATLTRSTGPELPQSPTAMCCKINCCWKEEKSLKFMVR